MNAGGAACAHRSQLEAWFQAGLRAVAPERALARVFEERADGLWIAGERLAPEAPIVAIAVGKAACAMARELERFAGDRIRAGLAITKHGHTLPLRHFEVREAGHPVPDARSAAAARAALALAAATRPHEVLVVLLSGGASALTASPTEGLSEADLMRTGEWLLACGADIEEVNCVRKHLGVIGGGRLAAAAGARRIELLAISDVPGDALDVIGSGPCAGDHSTWADALEVVRRRGGSAALPRAVVEVLRQGVAGLRAETLAPGDPRLAGVRGHVAASNADARRAAAEAARAAGWPVCDAGVVLAGEAREAGKRCVAGARRALGRGVRGVCIGGGETTVTLRGDGVGGRSQEVALAAALGERGALDWALLAAGTDGQDGPSDAAGAHADGATCERGRAAGVDAADALARNDSHGFFRREGGLLITGPTHTNVMDLALVAITPAGASR